MEENVLETEAMRTGTGARHDKWSRLGMAGLAIAGVQGCSDDSSGGSGAEQDLNTLCQGMVDDALAQQEMQNQDNLDLDMLCADMVSAAQMQMGDPDLDTLCADMVAEASTATSAEVTSQESKQYTFAELTQMCDDRGGYVQIHASCGSVNSCAGFSYGDWGEGAVLAEHTCAGANGCKGLSCIDLPDDAMRSADDIMAATYDEGGPGSCADCHTVNDDNGDPDPSKFKLFLLPGSARTVDNWLDLPAATQSRIVAFGSYGVDDESKAYAHMAAYKSVLSRAEIERVVDYIRTLEPVVAVVKTKDP